MQNLTILQLTQILNQDTIRNFSEWKAAEAEYQRRFAEYQPNPRKLEYPMELIYSLGFWSGNPLAVPMQCTSSFHKPNEGMPYLSLPYETKDGTMHMLCPECHRLEYQHYSRLFPNND